MSGQKPIITIPIGAETTELEEALRLIEQLKAEAASVGSDLKAKFQTPRTATPFNGQSSDKKNPFNALRSAANDPKLNGPGSFISRFDRSSRDSARSWGAIEKSTTNVFRSLVNINRSGAGFNSLLRGFGGIGGAAGALTAGALGSVLAAINNLSDKNKQARALGLPIGSAQAFDANFDKFGLSSESLRSIADAQGDVNRWGTFVAAGLRPEQIQREDPEQLAVDFYRAASQKFKTWMSQGLPATTLAKTYGFTDLASVEQLRTGSSYSEDDWGRAQFNYLQDAQRNAVNQGTADQATATKAALSSDWNAAINAFDTQLANAAPEVEALGKAASDAAVRFINFLGPQAKNVLDALQSDQPQPRSPNYPPTITGGLTKLGYGLRDTVPKLATTGTLLTNQKPQSPSWDWRHPFGTLQHTDSTQSSAVQSSAAPSTAARAAFNTAPPAREWIQQALPVVADIESGGNPKAMNSKSGAAGLYGIMPSNARAYGIDPTDPKASQGVATALLTDYFRRYKGDRAKALAAYNWGPGNAKNPRLDADIAAHGDDWLRYAPSETREYLYKAEQRGLDVFGDDTADRAYVRSMHLAHLAEHVGKAVSNAVSDGGGARFRKPDPININNTVTVDVSVPPGHSVSVTAGGIPQ